MFAELAAYRRLILTCDLTDIGKGKGELGVILHGTK
jgi:hypothetical protein